MGKEVSQVSHPRTWDTLFYGPGAALWGLAEAIWFFISPEVWLSFVTVQKGWRRAILVGVYALVGTLIGGIIMYLWSRESPVTVEQFLLTSPRVSSEEIQSVRRLFSEQGTWAFLQAAFTGIPYKELASQAPWHFSLPLFVVFSFGVRVFRSALMIALVHVLCGTLLRRWTMHKRRGLLCVFWGVFYFVYFFFLS